jgi:hypothetical protein
MNFKHITGGKHWRGAGPLALEKELLRRRDDAKEAEAV